MYHFVDKEGEERGVGVSGIAGFAASCLPLGLPVQPEQTTGFGASITDLAWKHRAKEKFHGLPFKFLCMYSKGLFIASQKRIWG